MEGYIELNVSNIIKGDICRLIIDIDDSSNGIKANEISNIFDTDIVLKNIKNKINILGGTILVSSNYGINNKITLILDQKIVKKEIINNKYEKLYKYKRILICDDNDASLKIIDKLLDKENIDIVKCTTGRECLDLIRSKENFDLIFTDEDMEIIDGHQLLSKLKNINGFNIPVILLTRNSNMEYTDEYKKEGFNGFLLKPIKKDKLLEIINNIK